MPSQHVGEEPDGQGHRTQDEDRDQLDQADQPAQADRDMMGPDGGRQVLDSVLLEPDEDEDHVGDQCQEQREGHPRRDREVDQRGHLEEIPHQDEEEQGKQVGHVLVALGADDVLSDAVPDELDHGLHHHLELRRDEPLAAQPEVEETDDDEGCQEDEEAGPAEHEVANAGINGEPWVSAEVEEVRHVCRRADHLVFDITLSGENQLVQVSSLSLPLETATASRTSRAR